MAREKEGYREQLESILERFPGKEWLTVSECAAYLGICRNTLAKRYPEIIKRCGTTRTQLARMLV